MKNLFIWILAVSGVLTCGAQVPGTGAYKFATLDQRGFDGVNVGNLNVRFTVPIVNKQGRDCRLVM